MKEVVAHFEVHRNKARASCRFTVYRGAEVVPELAEPPRFK